MITLRRPLLAIAVTLLAGCNPAPVPGGALASDAAGTPAVSLPGNPAVTLPGTFNEANLETYKACLQTKVGGSDVIGLVDAYKTVPAGQKAMAGSVVEAHLKRLGCL